MLLQKIVIEGIMPERALSKLQREGICVYHAKKLKKNQILLSVKKKDTEKVFAIYPDVCYNISVYSPYVSKKAGAEGLAAALEWSKRRIGVFIGAVLFLSATLFANRFVFKIDVTGATVYRREVLAVLDECGISSFSLYSEGREQEATAKILTLKDVSYCSVEKSGRTVRGDVRRHAVSAASPLPGDMVASHSGTVLHTAVLRGTPLKLAGESVTAGEALVGAYLVSENGDKTPVTAIARVTLSCIYDEIVAADSEERALAEGFLAADGEITEKLCEKTEGGYRVRLVYTVTETINF